MKRTVLAAITGIGMLTLAQGASAQGAVERGAQLFQDQKCFRCHSVDGKGNAKGPLDGVGDKLKTEELLKWMVVPDSMTTATKSERKPPMKAYPDLPKEDLDALVAYMESLKKK